MTSDTVVSHTISAAGAAFVESVVRLQPRVAVFDADGTLWSPDAGAEFFYWEVERGLLPPEVEKWAVSRYADYNAGRVGESPMCGEMVTIHAGLTVSTLERAADEFFRLHIEPKIFPEMRALIARLQQAGCELWIVSSTNQWVVEAGMRRFGVPGDHVLAAAVAIENGRASDRLLRIPTDGDKAVVLKQFLAGAPDAAFGNSLHDVAMLEMARHAFAINPNPDLKELARARGWTVYQPEFVATDERR